MSILFARFALLVAAAMMLSMSPAYADIYTWVDASGALNVSNLTPPDGARVIKVVHSSDDAPASKADTQALADRVRQLEDQIDMARQQPPPIAYPPPAPPVVYAPPAPPVVQYIFAPQPPTVQYVTNEAPVASPWCDATWSDCGYGNGWWPYYPASVFVVSGSNFNRFKPGNNFPMLRPRPHPVTSMSLIQPLNTPIVQPLVGSQGSSLLQAPRLQGFRRG